MQPFSISLLRQQKDLDGQIYENIELPPPTGNFFFHIKCTC